MKEMREFFVKNQRETNRLAKILAQEIVKKSLKNKTKRKKPQIVKQNTPPAKKQIFNTSMADALAKLKGKAQ